VIVSTRRKTRKVENVTDDKEVTLDELAVAVAQLRVYFHNLGDAVGFAHGAFEKLDNAKVFSEIDEHTGYASPEDVLNIEPTTA
jgi:hypothetical protein